MMLCLTASGCSGYALMSTFFSDIELKNIIDKLADFVSRNGPEFEQMTKNKQKGNAKFSFLFGGEFYNYYQYKVTTAQASKHSDNKNILILVFYFLNLSQ